MHYQRRETWYENGDDQNGSQKPILNKVQPQIDAEWTAKFLVYRRAANITADQLFA